MRKLFSFVVAAMLCASAAFAQSAIVSSRSTSISVTEQPSSTQWILRAGANFAGFSGDDADDLDRKFGYDVALSFQKPLSDFGMYWGMELGLGTRGYSYEDEDWDSKENLLAHNVRFSPFTFGYAYAINESVKIDAHLGAWVSYDIFGDFKYEWDDEEESESINDYEDYNNLDYGLTFGVGVWFNRFNLDLSWQRGLNELAKDWEANTNNIMLRVGVAF